MACLIVDVLLYLVHFTRKIKVFFGACLLNNSFSLSTFVLAAKYIVLFWLLDA